MILMILAAGLGTRLAPLTKHRPKPLIRYKGKPLLHYHIEKAIQAGFTKVVINTCHGTLIKEYIQIQNYQISVEISEEPFQAPHDTAYGITKALPLIGHKPFALISGDIFTDFDFANLKKDIKDDGHLILVKRDANDFGLAQEKIIHPGELTYANMGIFKPDLFSTLKSKTSLGQIMRTQGSFSGEIYTGTWHNIGTFKEFLS